MVDDERTAPTANVPTATDAPGRDALDLHVVAGPDLGLCFALAHEPRVLGRSHAADLRVRDPAISGRHVEIWVVEAGVELRDLGSTHGTHHAGRPVEHARLELGDSFAAGESRFVLARRPDRAQPARARWGELDGASPAMAELYARLDALAPTPLDVLILGETGTGKERTARTLHARSGRAGPLVVLDCGAMSASLAEATLFGVGKGAFTGADRDRPGVVEAAEGGTLLIDEVGELPLALQVKLLRVLDNREVCRLGEPERRRRVDVRVVAATHRELEAEVAAGRFRQDLYFRLARATVRLPPLRERERDAVRLAQVFLDQVCDTHGLDRMLGETAVAAILAHAWPGNVRELRNAVEQAAHLARGGVIEAADLGLPRPPNRPPRTVPVAEATPVPAHADYQDLHAELDRRLLASLLAEHDHNLSRIAKRLGISRDRLRARLRQLGLYARTPA